MPADLTLIASNSRTDIQPHILPCKIAHSGPVNAEPRYWLDKGEEDGTRTAYFRGRKFRGRKVEVPAGYDGLVLQKTDRTILDVPAVQPGQFEDDDDEGDGYMTEAPAMPKEVGVTEIVGGFDSVTVWGHEVVPDAAGDAYLKGVEEWIRFAQALHGSGVDVESS